MVMGMSDVVAPFAYDDASYRRLLGDRLKQQEVSVLSALFVPSKYSSESILLAATNFGRVYFFRMNDILHDQQQEDESTGLLPTPAFSFKAHQTEIYSMCVTGPVQDPILITGGDQDFRVWKWMDLLDAVSDPRQDITPLRTAHLSQQPVGSRGSLLPYCEINAIGLSQVTDHVFFAGGDANAHEWDLNAMACVRQYVGHKEFLHSVQHLNKTQELVTGSDDGTVALWDVRSGSSNSRVVLAPTVSSTSPECSTGSSWVRSVMADRSETWMVCGGGRQQLLDGKARPTESGFLCMWHLPSRVPVHYTPTTHEIHDVHFYQNAVLSVGNENRVNKWNQATGEMVASTPSSMRVANFCVEDEITHIVAVGGKGPLIDIYTMPGIVGVSVLVDHQYITK